MGEGESLPPVNKRLDGGPELNGPRSGRMKKKKYFLFNFEFTRVFYPPASMKQMVDVRFLFYKLRHGAKKYAANWFSLDHIETLGEIVHDYIRSRPSVVGLFHDVFRH